MAITAPSAAPKRPIVLSADKRKISYTSKSGKTLTVELKQSSRAVETLRELAKRETAEEVDVKQASDTKDPNASFFDTISFWCMEAVEIACFGPYDEVRNAEPAKPAT